MKIGVLGATGQSGRDIAEWLVNAGFVETVLIGRNANKLASLRDEIYVASGRVLTIAVADAADQKALIAIFKDIEMVVIAVSSAEHLSVIVDAAIATKTDCLDILLCSDRKRQLLESKRAVFERQGITYITDGGYHPGVPAALALYAESLCSGLQNVEVYGSFGVNWRRRMMSLDTAVDFIRAMAVMDMGMIKDGTWVSDWRNMRKFDFGDGRGPQDCMPMGMEEMRELPRSLPSIKNAGFFIAGFGRVMDWAIMPLSLLALKTFPSSIRTVSRFFAWGLKTFGGDKEWAQLKLKANGAQGSVEVILSYNDAYELTALPVIACLKQYTEGAKRPGLHRQALFVNPTQFIDDMKKMGVSVQSTLQGHQFQ